MDTVIVFADSPPTIPDEYGKYIHFSKKVVLYTVFWTFAIVIVIMVIVVLVIRR